MKLITSDAPHQGQVSEHREDAARPFSSTLLQSALISWPARLCLKCASMTGTLEGLQELISPNGYKHHMFSDLKESVE